MDIDKIKDALQDLIIRLQDAEKGFNEIKLATSNKPLRKWLDKYSTERHNMHKVLESHVALLGGDADVKTSFLGDLHRMFIDIKINSTSQENEFDAIVKEIDRGATQLINDYTNVIENIETPLNLNKILVSQRATIQYELDQMINLKDELNAIEA